MKNLISEKIKLYVKYAKSKQRERKKCEKKERKR